MTYKTLSATAVATILLVAGAPAPARAELSCPTASSPEEATTLAGENFAAAQEAYEMGRPLRAMAHYQCSYQLRPHNSTLYNLGVLAEGIGETDVAISSYREYLERYPDGEERDEISRRLRELEARATPEEPPPVEPPPEEPPVEPPPVEPPPEEPPPTEPPPTEPPPEEQTGEGRVSTGRIMAFVTLGLGVAIGAVGGVFLGMASATNDQLWSDIEEREADRDQLVSDSDWGWMQETVGWILVATGAAAVAGSILLFVLAPARRPAESNTARTTVAPFVTADGGGLSFQGRF